MLPIQKMFTNYNNSPRNEKPKFIVIHDVGSVSNAKNNANYFGSGDRGASADFFVDSDNIIQIIDYHTKYSWSIGDGRGKFGKTNENSVSIEMCLESDYQPSAQTIKNTIDLTIYLMNELNIPIDNVYRHYDCSGKQCPNSFSANNWEKWTEFKSKLEQENKSIFSIASISTTSPSPSIMYRVILDGKQIMALSNQDSAINKVKEEVDLGNAKKGVVQRNTDSVNIFEYNKSEISTETIIPETEKHLIIGKAEITTEQAEQYLHKINPDAPYYAEIYKEEAEKEGVRWDYAFSQTIKETNHFRFGGIALPEWNNFSGIGVTGAKYIPEQAKEEQFIDGVIVIKDINNKSVGVKFSTPRLGIRCQIQHLKAYSSSESLVGECIDPRFHLVTRGIAPYIEGLNGRWAVPGTTYGQDIVEICNRIAKEVVEEKEKYEIPTGNNITPLNGGYGWIESLPDQKRVIIHANKYDYISVGEEGIYLYAKDKDCVKLI